MFRASSRHRRGRRHRGHPDAGGGVLHYSARTFCEVLSRGELPPEAVRRKMHFRDRASRNQVCTRFPRGTRKLDQGLRADRTPGECLSLPSSGLNDRRALRCLQRTSCSETTWRDSRFGVGAQSLGKAITMGERRRSHFLVPSCLRRPTHMLGSRAARDSFPHGVYRRQRDRHLVWVMSAMVSLGVSRLSRPVLWTGAVHLCHRVTIEISRHGRRRKLTIFADHEV